MNLIHRYSCNSATWANVVRTRMLPWVLGENVNLGDNVLEIGPGPGRTTEWLRERVPQLTAIEIDHKLAEKLRRLATEKVTIVEGDATKMSLPSDTYSSA